MNEPARKMVLIVEDDAATQQLLVALLRREKYDAAVAADGRRAIEMLETQTFHAVILDLMMPDVGGQEVIDFLAKDGRAVPVIVCTAAGPRVTDAIDSPLVKAIVRKPFDIDELINAVASIP